MQELTRKPRTSQSPSRRKASEEIQISVRGERFKFPRSRAEQLLESLRKLAVEFQKSDEQSVPWREAFKNRLDQGGEPATVLRGLRSREDLTQQELADKLGIPQGNVAAMESGKRPIGKDMAKRLAEVFKSDYRVFL